MAAPLERVGLDAAGFDRLLIFLETGDRSLGGYEAARARLIDFFRWRGIRDPEAYADRTFDRVAAKLAAGETPTTSEPFRYLLGVARYIYLEGTRDEIKAREALTNGQWSLQSNTATDDELLSHLDACLDGLHPQERGRLLAYHRGSGRERIRARAKLAEDLDVSLSSLRVQMYRLRLRVEKCIHQRRKREIEPRETTPSTS